jgi:hypothetical protein
MNVSTSTKDGEKDGMEMEELVEGDDSSKRIDGATVLVDEIRYETGELVNTVEVKGEPLL